MWTVECMLQTCELPLLSLLQLANASSLSHLVGFALRLRNLGLSDHGVIRELSTPLAGSLYAGEGHSRIYDDDAVYR